MMPNSNRQDRFDYPLQTNCRFLYSKTVCCVTEKQSHQLHDYITCLLNMPYREKACFLHMRKKRCRSAAELISTFVFATYIVQSLYFLNPKSEACSHLLSLYSQVCVEHDRKPRRQVYSCRSSNKMAPK